MKSKKIIAQISKNIKKKKWECFENECQEKSINSHLLQKNGVLNNISDDNHFFELEMTDPNKWDFKKTPPFEFRKKGIKQALSFPLFCNPHDSSIFKSIESDSTDFKSYKSFLLFSYRTICAEIRIKEINVELYKRILNSETLKRSNIKRENYESSIKGSLEGIENLHNIKNELIESFNKNIQSYNHFTFSYPKFDIYASAIFSAEDIFNENEKEPTDIFIHIIPLKTELVINLGYHKKKHTEELNNYCNSWKNLNELDFKKKLTTLFYKNIENWGLSPKLYYSLKQENINKYLNRLVENRHEYGISSLEDDFNLFE